MSIYATPSPKPRLAFASCFDSVASTVPATSQDCYYSLFAMKTRSTRGKLSPCEYTQSFVLNLYIYCYLQMKRLLYM